MLEKKRQEEQANLDRQEHERWQKMQSYDYENYLEKIAPNVDPAEEPLPDDFVTKRAIDKPLPNPSGRICACLSRWGIS